MAARQSRSAAAPARLDNADPVALREFILLFEAWPSRTGPRATTVVRPQKPQWPLGDQRPTTLHLGVALVGWRESQWPPRHAPIDGYLFLAARPYLARQRFPLSPSPARWTPPVSAGAVLLLPFL